MAIDLTPFGFTPTEAAVYQRLLALGPSSGYGVAKDAGLARANAYSALDGLVAKGAALVEEAAPKLYRPVAPHALLARIAAQESAKLDRLDEQVAAEGRGGAPATVAVSGEREFSQMALRTAARHPGPAVFLGPPGSLAMLLPVWRKRDADGAPTHLFASGDPDPAFPLPLAGAIAAAEVHRFFGSQVSLLLTSEAAIGGAGEGSELAGFWTTDRLLVGLLYAAAERVTGESFSF
jgi:hypothetical protein